jgi:hypothetical protein
MDARFNRAPRANPIVGRYFISADGDEHTPGWSGQILSEISNGHFLVQLFARNGERSGQRSVHVARMSSWQLYVTREEWAEARASGGGK